MNQRCKIQDYWEQKEVNRDYDLWEKVVIKVHVGQHKTVVGNFRMKYSYRRGKKKGRD